MSAYGRKRPFDSALFRVSERPLSGKADIQELAAPESLRNDRFTPGSGHWTDRMTTGRKRPNGLATVRQLTDEQSALCDNCASQS